MDDRCVVCLVNSVRRDWSREGLPAFIFHLDILL